MNIGGNIINGQILIFSGDLGGLKAQGTLPRPPGSPPGRFRGFPGNFLKNPDFSQLLRQIGIKKVEFWGSGPI